MRNYHAPFFYHVRLISASETSILTSSVISKLPFVNAAILIIMLDNELELMFVSLASKLNFPTNPSGQPVVS